MKFLEQAAQPWRTIELSNPLRPQPETRGLAGKVSDNCSRVDLGPTFGEGVGDAGRDRGDHADPLHLGQYGKE